MVISISRYNPVHTKSKITENVEKIKFKISWFDTELYF